MLTVIPHFTNVLTRTQVVQIYGSSGATFKNLPEKGKELVLTNSEGVRFVIRKSLKGLYKVEHFFVT